LAVERIETMQRDKKDRALNRKIRVRKHIGGTAERPRLALKFSGKHIYAQCVDDEAGKTLVFLSTLDREVRPLKPLANVAGAMSFGKEFGVRAVSAGVRNVVFDRGARRYHGCMKAFADAARAAGLAF
jgi:large subunit ribosomal protein L18